MGSVRFCALPPPIMLPDNPRRTRHPLHTAKTRQVASTEEPLASAWRSAAALAGIRLPCRVRRGVLVDTRVLGRRREKTKSTLKIDMFDSREYRQDRPQRLKKKKMLNIQEFRPGRSVMQWHCDLRLSLKIFAVHTYVTVPYCTWSVVLRPLFVYLINGPITTLFEIDC